MCLSEREEGHDCYRDTVSVNGRDYTVTHCEDDRTRVEVEADGIGTNGSGEVIGRWDGREFVIDLPAEVRDAVKSKLVAAGR